jgi:anti-sigma regulatory factor (Ser/Thr protein kinase)
MMAMPITERTPNGSGPTFSAVAESSDPGARTGAAPLRDWHVRLSLDADLDAASRARTALDELDGRLEEDVLEDMRLLVTELVTNSVRHAEADPRDPIHLEVSVGPDRVLITVQDGGRGFHPEPRTPVSPADGGWGLYLVSRVSDRWGVDGDGRTRVWLELARSRRRVRT